MKKDEERRDRQGQMKKAAKEMIQTRVITLQHNQMKKRMKEAW